jgi:hypothetical protein
MKVRTKPHQRDSRVPRSDVSARPRLALRTGRPPLLYTASRTLYCTMSKGISSVTLGLRFMQKAALLEEGPAPASTSAGASGSSAAALQDESHWELAGSAKEGWGTSVALTPKACVTSQL